MSDSVRVPLHYPCAARVKMPQIGSEDSDITTNSTMHQNSITSIKKSSSFDVNQKSLGPLKKSCIYDVSNNLSFTEDVVRDRCFYMLPYDDKYFWEALDVSNLIPVPPKQHITVGRHNARGADKRHVPCISAKPSGLKPLKPKIAQKALKMHKKAALKTKSDQNPSSDNNVSDPVENEENTDKCVFLTEVDSAKPILDKMSAKFNESEEFKRIEFEKAESERKSGRKADWAAYLMSIISPLTANWIVHHRMTGGGGVSDKAALSQLLEGWYGKPEHTDLIRDDISETELQVTKPVVEKEKKQWRKEEAVLLQKIFKPGEEPQARDPYSDENETPFYRQPIGFRKQRKKIEKEEQGAINSTARNIEVKTYEPSPPPTLRDYFNPEAGETLIETDNMFQREWLTGSEQIYQGKEEELQILMSSQNKYHKQLRKQYPDNPNQWYAKDDIPASPSHPKPIKGARRWKALPEPVDDANETLKLVPPGTEPPAVAISDAKTKKVKQQNPALSQIIDEWRSKWQLSGQFTDSSPADLLRDMADIQPHVRLKAIATIGKAAVYKPPQEDGIQLDYQDQQDDVVSRLPEYIFEALNCLLEDNHDQVKKAAAVTLYSLNKPSDKAEKILRELLFSDSSTDRWAAAQCLTHFGVCDSEVADEVIKQLLATQDAIKHEQAIQLLSKMSASTTLVHSMVAEQLNSSSWRHRVIACKIFPTLDGTINKDITNKLSYLMWKDWHLEVRKAAAQTLGKTGHGRDVHDDLREKIKGSDEQLKLEAISRVGHLGIMTAKLLPVILDCFDDEYNSVRMEVCITSGNLMITDTQVMDKLLYLATFDPVWKVKALAIQAIGKIRVSSPKIIEGLMWALRYEKEAGVRAEACHTLLLLDYKGDDFIEILQERLLVEDDNFVKKELSAALKYQGVSSNEDIDTVAQIKSEVHKLCDQSIIASQIMSKEQDEAKRQTMSRMIHQAQQELGRFFSRTNTYLKMNSRLDIEKSSETFCIAEDEVKQVNFKCLSEREFKTLSEPGCEIREEKRTTDSETRDAIFHRTQDQQTPEFDKVSCQSFDADKDDGSLRSLTSLSARSKSHMDQIPEESDIDEKTDFNDTKSEIDLKSELELESETTASSGGRSQLLTHEALTDLENTSRSGVSRGQLLPDKKDEYQSETLEVNTPGGYKSPFVKSHEDTRSSLSRHRSSSRRQTMSRETIQERERINAEARKSLLTLSDRYSSMMECLKQLDEGLTAETPSQIKTNADSKTEKIISNIPI